MTDEQKREEFEAAYVAELVRRCGEGFRETAMYSLTAKEPNGDYQHYTDGIAWWGWQASRANLVSTSPVVALPRQSPYANMAGDYAKGYRQASIDYQSAIEAAGVKVSS